MKATQWVELEPNEGGYYCMLCDSDDHYFEVTSNPELGGRRYSCTNPDCKRSVEATLCFDNYLPDWVDMYENEPDDSDYPEDEKEYL
jgi:hypothetical protein